MRKGLINGSLYRHSRAILTILGLMLGLVPVLAPNASALPIPPTAPVCNDESVTVEAGQTILIDLSDNCTDVNDNLDLSTLTVVMAPSAGTLTPTGPGTVSYEAPTPAPGVIVTFTFTMADLTGLVSNVATVSITITQESKCTSGKYKAAGKKFLGKLKCLAKAVKKADPVDPACLQKVEEKFVLKWGKAEEDADCLTTGDEAAIETMVDEFVTDLKGALEPGGGPLP